MRIFSGSTSVLKHVYVVYSSLQSFQFIQSYIKPGPTDLDDKESIRIDDKLMHVLKNIIIPNNLFLKKDQLVKMMRDEALRTFPTTRKAHFNYVSYILAENHYK